MASPEEPPARIHATGSLAFGRVPACSAGSIGVTVVAAVPASDQNAHRVGKNEPTSALRALSSAPPTAAPTGATQPPRVLHVALLVAAELATPDDATRREASRPSSIVASAPCSSSRCRPRPISSLTSRDRAPARPRAGMPTGSERAHLHPGSPVPSLWFRGAGGDTGRNGLWATRDQA